MKRTVKITGFDFAGFGYAQPADGAMCSLSEDQKCSLSVAEGCILSEAAFRWLSEAETTDIHINKPTKILAA